MCAVAAAPCGAAANTTGTASSSAPASHVAAVPSSVPATFTAIAARDAGLSSAQIFRLLAGIPQSGAWLGKPTAPITLTLYGDLECPICQTFVLRAGFPKLVARDVRAGKVRVLYRAFQTSTISRSVFMTQQIAALAAGQQRRFWQFAMLFLRQQGVEGRNYVTEKYLDELAHEIPGLDFANWQRARHEPALAAHVRADQRSGDRRGVIGTPTVILHGPRGSAGPRSPVPDYRELEATLKSVA